MSAPDKVTEYPNGTRIEFWEKGHKYAVNGEKGFTSVTQILGMFDKPELLSWAQNIGALGVLKLSAYGYSLPQFLADQEATLDDWKAAGSRDELFGVLKQHSLRTWDLTDKAKDRGNEVHNALQSYGETGAIPILSDYDPEVRPYVQGLAAFLIDAEPEIVSSEIMVASTEHHYVGTYDLRAVMPPRSLVLDMGTGERWDIPMGVHLGDAKTGKRIYDEAYEQLAGYELASIECGCAPTDGRFVVRFAEGKYEVRPSFVDVGTFGAYAAAYHARKATRADQKKQTKELGKAVAA
jgi:hypothetical protein